MSDCSKQFELTFFVVQSNTVTINNNNNNNNNNIFDEEAPVTQRWFLLVSSKTLNISLKG